mmetsp:Transcript_6429/g.16013  ORF Transcript_6429/g.16013 Transcript_6429/m.16013 type:complete len:253 (-) Transcript_6429:437-1195(-)
MLELSRLCRRLMPSCSEPERRRWRTLTVAMYLAHGHAPEMWIEHKSLVVPSSTTPPLTRQHTMLLMSGFRVPDSAGLASVASSMSSMLTHRSNPRGSVMARPTAPCPNAHEVPSGVLEGSAPLVEAHANVSVPQACCFQNFAYVKPQTIVTCFSALLIRARSSSTFIQPSFSLPNIRVQSFAPPARPSGPSDDDAAHPAVLAVIPREVHRERSTIGRAWGARWLPVLWRGIGLPDVGRLVGAAKGGRKSTEL